jgi:hypothetical protein
VIHQSLVPVVCKIMSIRCTFDAPAADRRPKKDELDVYKTIAQITDLVEAVGRQ